MPFTTVPYWNDWHQRVCLLWWRSESVYMEVTVFVEMSWPSCLWTPVKHRHSEYTSLRYKGYESLTITVYKTEWKTFFGFFCVCALFALSLIQPALCAGSRVILTSSFMSAVWSHSENPFVAHEYESCVSCKCTPAWVIAAGAIPCSGYCWETCSRSALKLYHLSFPISERYILQLTRFGGFLEVFLRTLCICLSVANLKKRGNVSCKKG